MNKKLIVIVVGVLLALGVGTWLFVRRDKENNNQSSQSSQSQQSETSTNANDETEITGNLQNLRTGGKAQECTMSYSDTSGSGSGKMYTDGNGRGLMQFSFSTSSGNTGDSNTLITGDKVYSWTKTGGNTIAFQFDTSSLKTDTDSSTASTSSAQTAGKNYSLKCKNWAVDESMFAVPTDVNFMSLPAGQ